MSVYLFFGGFLFAQPILCISSTLLLKPLHHPWTANEVTNLLLQFLRISQREQSSQTSSPQGLKRMVNSASLGYFIALLPGAVRHGRLDELLVAAGLDDMASFSGPPTDFYGKLIGRLCIENEDTAFLVFAMLAGLLRQFETDQEFVALVTAMTTCSHRFKEAYRHLYVQLLHCFKLSQIIDEFDGPVNRHQSIFSLVSGVAAETESVAVLHSAQAFIRLRQALGLKREDATTSNSNEGARILAELGFPALASKEVAVYSEADLAGPTAQQAEAAVCCLVCVLA